MRASHPPLIAEACLPSMNLPPPSDEGPPPLPHAHPHSHTTTHHMYKAHTLLSSIAFNFACGPTGGRPPLPAGLQCLAVPLLALPASWRPLPPSLPPPPTPPRTPAPGTPGLPPPSLPHSLEHHRLELAGGG